MTPAELPGDLINKPEIRLRDLQPGASGWIIWNDMVVDPDRRCFLDPEAKIHEEMTLLSIRVTRTEAGFEVLIPAPMLGRSLRWTPGAFSVQERYFPVLKLERATESGDRT